MPRIAIAPCSKLPDYVESVRRVGGDPRVLDRATDRPADVLRGVSGLLLAGGGDVDPAMYGEAPHATFDAAEPGRDAYEVELVNRAIDLDLPVLAICRGVQLLNVARGGTLVQDIPSEITRALTHSLASPPHDPFQVAHAITVEPGSRLAAILGGPVRHSGTIDVNSRHHQAVKTPGEGLRVVASSSDGVVEAVEDPDRRFLVGVQWHPENFWRSGQFAALFDAFVSATLRSSS